MDCQSSPIVRGGFFRGGFCGPGDVSRVPRGGWRKNVPRRPACSRMLPSPFATARTATLVLRGCTRAPATGTRLAIDLKLMARAHATPVGAGGAIRAAMYSLSAAKNDARWFDREGYERGSFYFTTARGLVQTRRPVAPRFVWRPSIPTRKAHTVSSSSNLPKVDSAKRQENSTEDKKEEVKRGRR